jgi:cytochrome P450
MSQLEQQTMTTPLAKKATRRIAPGPRGSLVNGNLEAFKRGPIQMILDLQRQFGDVARNRLGPYMTHTLVHPDGAEHVLKNNHENYVRGRFYENFKLFFGEGLLTLDGKSWFQHRRITQPLFHKRRIEKMAGTMVDCTEVMLREWDNRRERTALDLLPDMIKVSLAVLSRVMFNVDVSGDTKEICPPLELAIRAMMPQTDLYRMLPRWVPTPYNRRVSRGRQTLDRVIARVIEERRTLSVQDDDLISMLLGARDADTGKGMENQEIYDEIRTILMAGHETTATGLGWTFYALSQHPEVRRRLRDELERVLAGRTPTLADLSNLPYLRQVIDESLRVYPPIWGYTRDAIKDDEIGGYHIPGGSTVFLCPFATHRHPEFWSNPDAFDPERFAPGADANRPRYAYFPFGGGPRQCIGLHMAIMQMQIVVAMVTQRYDVDVVPGYPVEYGRLVSLRPLRGLVMTINERQAA